MRLSNRQTIWGLLGLSAFLLAGVGFRYQQTHPKSPVNFETTRADRGRIVAKVTATGTLSALVTVQIGSQVSGRLKEILVDFNSPVKKGQVLATIDPQLFQAALEQAKANYVAAEAGLTAAKVRALDQSRQLSRSRSLAERQLIAQADLDTAQANADLAKAQVDASRGQVEQTRAALHQAQVNLAYTTITSPIDGIVVSRNVDVGQTVAASLQAPTLFVLAEDLRKMQVDTSIAEADIGKLTTGMAAQFSVDAYPTERFKGTVRQIRNAPQTVQNVVTYDAVIDVDNSNLKLKPGMTANVTLVYADRTNALRVPNSALRFRPSAQVVSQSPEASRKPARPKPEEELGRKTVWALRDGKPEPVPILPGVTDGTMTEVLEGHLREGEPVIIEATGEGSGKIPGGGAPGFRRMF